MCDVMCGIGERESTADGPIGNTALTAWLQIVPH